MEGIPIKHYSTKESQIDETERKQKLWRAATKFYFKLLFKKTISSLKNLQYCEYKAFWFNQLVKVHFEYKCKEDILREYNNKLIEKTALDNWVEAYRKCQKMKTFVFILNEFREITLQKAGFQALLQDYHMKVRLAKLLKKKAARKKKAYLDLWRKYIEEKTLRKLKKGKAYEYQYISILRKVFDNWEKGCEGLREEERNKQLLKKYFGYLKEVVNFVESKKKKLSVLFRELILLRVFFRSFKERAWVSKRNKIATRFLKYQLFTAWNIVITKLKHKKELKTRAEKFYKITKKKKYFERLWEHYARARKIAKEKAQKLALFQQKRSRNIKHRYFTILKQHIVINYVSDLFREKVLTKCFTAWYKCVHEAVLLKKRRKEFKKLRTMRQMYNCFGVFKHMWLFEKRKELIADQCYKLGRLKRGLIGLYEAKKQAQREKEEKAVNHYIMTTKEKIFYTMFYHKLQSKQEKKREEKLDWFIEKKIRKVATRVLRNLKLWAIANKKYNTYMLSLVHQVFYKMKLQMKLQRLQ